MPENDVVVLHPAGLDADFAAWVRVPRAAGLTLVGDGTDVDLDGLVHRVADRLDGPRHVIGCSLGAMVAARLALQRPDLVASLLLACAPASVPSEVILARAASTRERGAAALVDETLERWFSTRMLASGDPAVTYARDRLGSISTDALAATWTAIAGHDLTGRLGSITCPTTCVAGSDDASAPPETVRRLADAIPGARYREIPGPHMLPLEHPDQFAALVREHLDWASNRQPSSEGRSL